MRSSVALLIEVEFEKKGICFLEPENCGQLRPHRTLVLLRPKLPDYLQAKMIAWAPCVSGLIRHR